jgi:hypothetical protein
MKKPVRFNILFWQLAFFFLLANIQLSSAQDVKDQITAIPDSINRISQTSCMPCHGSEGRPTPQAKLNFSKWNEYDEATKEEKASKICSAISEGTMPPKFIRESKPELIPSKKQTELICKWAESLKQKELSK